jgi:hypothetical protein
MAAVRGGRGGIWDGEEGRHDTSEGRATREEHFYKLQKNDVGSCTVFNGAQGRATSTAINTNTCTQRNSKFVRAA